MSDSARKGLSRGPGRRSGLQKVHARGVACHRLARFSGAYTRFSRAYMRIARAMREPGFDALAIMPGRFGRCFVEAPGSGVSGQSRRLEDQARCHRPLHHRLTKRFSGTCSGYRQIPPLQVVLVEITFRDALKPGYCGIRNYGRLVIGFAMYNRGLSSNFLWKA